MSRVVVLGGGVIGTLHAYFALHAGHEVIHVERDLVPQSASVRNFGLIWVSGRAAGPELDLALRARELWETIGNNTSIGFRPNGSLTIAQNDLEFEVIERALNLPDAKARGFEVIDAKQVKDLEPALRGHFIGALRCYKDAAVEPLSLLSGLREAMSRNPKYQWINRFEAVDFSHDENGNHITSSSKVKISGDYLAICPGIYDTGFTREFLDTQALRKVYLQMAATEQMKEKVLHSLADADSLRYYPGFKDLPLELLPEQNEIAVANKMQLLLCQRDNGSMTIGDTHQYDEPFPHEIVEPPYEHLLNVIENIFGRRIKIEKRWTGIYSQSTTSDIYFRKEIGPNASIITGGGGRGNTLAPAIAEETMNLWKM